MPNPPGTVLYDTVPAPAPARVTKPRQWRMVHRRHDGTALGEAFPTDPQFALYLGKVGFCNYDLDMDSALSVKVNTEPYATDYDLCWGDRVIQSGMHTDIQIDDIESHTLKVSGKDWYHWFEMQTWPFDPVNPLANVYSAFQRDMFSIVEDWLTVIQSFANTIQFTYANGLSGVLANAKIDVNDSENMFNKLQSLGQASPGFDMDITPDKHINLYYPQKNRVTNVVLEQGSNIFGFTYHNAGPTGTYLLGTAQGPSSKIGVAVSDAQQPKYRRLMQTQDFNTVQDAGELGFLTNGQSGRNAKPHLEFTVKVIPDFVDDIFSVISLGDSIVVLADLGYDYINDTFRLVSITGSPNNEGEQEYELGFDDGTISL